MDQNNQEEKNNGSQEVSFTDLAFLIRRTIGLIRRNIRFLIAAGILGALLGLAYSFIKKPTYVAVCTFVLEDSKGSGSLGQYAGLASLAGISLGDGGGGIFQGDNILELYRSRLMIEKALLSEGVFNGKKRLLIDRFVDYYKFRNKWKDEVGVGEINFNGNPENFNRKQDSLITELVDMFNKKILNVDKPDKKLSIIKVQVETKDELFSKLFTEKLVENVNQFYIQTKTKKTYQNVQILQHQADSVKNILNSSINGVASAIDAAPNANPLMSTLRVSSQKKQVDVQANTAIYSEMVKNLELAKISFRQDMPLIQVIDKPVMPLHENKVAKISSTFLGAIALFFIAFGFLVVRRLWFSVFK